MKLIKSILMAMLISTFGFGAIAQTYNQQKFNFDNTDINHFNVINAEESDEKFVMVTKFHGPTKDDLGKAVKIMRLDANDQVIWSNTFYDNNREGVRGLRLEKGYSGEDPFLYALTTVWEEDDNRYVGGVLEIDMATGSLVNDFHFATDENEDFINTYPFDLDYSEYEDALYISGFDSRDEIMELEQESEKRSFFMKLDNDNWSVDFLQIQATPDYGSTGRDYDMISRIKEVPGEGYVLLGSRNYHSTNPHHNVTGEALIQHVDYSGNDIWNYTFYESGDVDIAVDAVRYQDIEDDVLFVLLNNAVNERFYVVALETLSGNLLYGMDYILQSSSTPAWRGFDMELAWNDKNEKKELRIGGIAKEESNSYHSSNSPTFLLNLNLDLTISSSELFLEVPSYNVQDHGGFFGAFPGTPPYNTVCETPFYTPDILATDNDGDDNYLLGFHRWDDVSPINLEFFNLDATGSDGINVCDGTSSGLITEDFTKDKIEVEDHFDDFPHEIYTLIVDEVTNPHTIEDCTDRDEEEVEGLKGINSLNAPNSNINDQVSIYPTILESTDAIYIESDQHQVSFVTIYDMSGKVVFKNREIAQKDVEITLDGQFNEGAHLVFIELENNEKYSVKINILK